jgi:hypothetical protein
VTDVDLETLISSDLMKAVEELIGISGQSKRMKYKP